MFVRFPQGLSKAGAPSGAINLDRTVLQGAVRRTPLWLYLLCVAPPALVLAATFVQPFVPPSVLLRDWPVVVVDAGAPPHLPLYYGFVSNLGVMAWVSAAGVCVFAGWLLATRSSQRHGALFLLCAGALTAVLAVDDFFMFHDKVFDYLTGLTEPYLISVYAIAFAAYLVSFREIILRQHCMLLLLASAFFALSAVVDLFLEDILWGSDLLWFLEDGMKAFGIWTWVVFWYRTAWDLVAAEFRARA